MHKYAILDVDDTLMYYMNDINEPFLKSLVTNRITDVILFTKMSLRDINQKSAEGSFSRVDLIERMKTLGLKIHFVSTPQDCVYKKGIAGEYFDEIYIPHFPVAVEIAQKLLSDLKIARDTYLMAINKDDCDIEKTGKQFKRSCKDAIDAAKPVLARDLSWGEYLGNLMLSLVNAVISIVSFGQVNAFFSPVKSKSEIAVEQAETDFLDTGKVNLS